MLAIFSGKFILNFAFGATAFAERSVAMKAPVGLLSGRAVCASRWRGFAPTSSADAPVFHFHGRGRNGKRHLQRRFLWKRGGFLIDDLFFLTSGLFAAGVLFGLSPGLFAGGLGLDRGIVQAGHGIQQSALQAV